MGIDHCGLGSSIQVSFSHMCRPLSILICDSIATANVEKAVYALIPLRSACTGLQPMPRWVSFADQSQLSDFGPVIRPKRAALRLVTKHSPTADFCTFDEMYVRHPAEGAEKEPSFTKLFLAKGSLESRITLGYSIKTMWTHDYRANSNCSSSGLHS